MIELGEQVKDKISGFKGIAIARTEYLNGCYRIAVQAKLDKEGKPIETQWFDEPQLDIVGKKKVEKGKKDTGGPGSVKPMKFRNAKR